MPNCVGVSSVSFVDPRSKASATPPRTHLYLLQLGHESVVCVDVRRLKAKGKEQPRPQSLLAFQYGGGRREDVFSPAAAILESEKTLGTRLRKELPFFLPFRTPGQAGYEYRIPPPPPPPPPSPGLKTLLCFVLMFCQEHMWTRGFT